MSTSKTKAKSPKKKRPAAPKPQPRVATPTEVAAEIAELTRLLPLIPPTTLFGDDNIARIDAEIRVLVEDMNEGDVMDTWFPHDGSSFPDSDNPEEMAQDVNAEEGRSFETESSARSAIEWRDGHSTDKPSDGWLPLVK